MSIDTNYATLSEVLAYHVQPGWAVEFGVYSGYSIHMIGEKMPVIGFDSFDGLPEDWRPGFPAGKFRDGILKHLPVYPSNVLLVAGWFDKTVPDFPFPPLSLVHIDCDLYSSTVTALAGVTPHVQVGTVIVFDEFTGYPGWEGHEAKAWSEWCGVTGVTVEQIAANGEEVAFVIRDLGRLA